MLLYNYYSCLAIITCSIQSCMLLWAVKYNEVPGLGHVYWCVLAVMTVYTACSMLIRVSVSGEGESEYGRQEDGNYLLFVIKLI